MAMVAQASTIPVQIPQDIEVVMYPVPDRVLCSCVLYAQYMGYLVYGDAWNVSINTSTPTVGSLAVFRYNNGLGHIAIVEQVLQDGITVSETNFERCQWTRRFVEFDNYALRGYRDP